MKTGQQGSASCLFKSGGISLEGNGIGYIADILVFALLISTSIAILSSFGIVVPRIEDERYASSLAQSTLLSFQYSTAEQFGGFEYQLGAFGLEAGIPFIEESARRELSHKTLCQLLVESATLNLRVEFAGVDMSPLRPNAAMEESTRDLLKKALDWSVGGKFGYRFLAWTESINLNFVRIYFSMGVSNFSEAKNQLCSESMLLSLPISKKEIAQMIGFFGATLPRGFDINSMLEIQLELWSL